MGATVSEGRNEQESTARIAVKSENGVWEPEIELTEKFPQTNGNFRKSPAQLTRQHSRDMSQCRYQHVICFALPVYHLFCSCLIRPTALTTK
jgi:hypothetical protein